jgi:hypothetical protein
MNIKFNSQICTSRNKGGGVIKHHKVYALKGNEFYEFDSVPEAAEKTGCCKTKIYKCCNGKLAYTGGYVWSYQPLDIPTEVEEWRDVKGYENLYQVSRKGKVRSSHKGYWEVLTSVVNRHGYNQYLFHKDGKRKNMRGNRLVAEAYIPNPDNLPFVNHKDENPANDCVENLEWCTAKYNNNYGTARQRSSINHSKNRPVCMFNVDGTFIREFYNINDAARFVDGAHTCILRCCNNKVFCYKGYIWRYKEDADSVMDAVALYKNSKTTNRKIEVCLNGEVKAFNSMSEAARELKISRDTLRKYNHLGDISWKII